MSFGTVLVAIAGIIAIVIMQLARYRAGQGDWHGRSSAPKDEHHLPSPREQELTREIEDLQARLAVLERIATEDRHSKSVAAEIESLRDR